MSGLANKPFMGDSLARAAAYIQSVFQEGGLGLCVTDQAYQYYGQRVVNVIATPPTMTRASAYLCRGRALRHRANDHW